MDFWFLVVMIFFLHWRLPYVHVIAKIRDLMVSCTEDSGRPCNILFVFQTLGRSGM